MEPDFLVHEDFFLWLDQGGFDLEVGEDRHCAIEWLENQLRRSAGLDDVAQTLLEQLNAGRWADVAAHHDRWLIDRLPNTPRFIELVDSQTSRDNMSFGELGPTDRLHVYANLQTIVKVNVLCLLPRIHTSNRGTLEEAILASLLSDLGYVGIRSGARIAVSWVSSTLIEINHRVIWEICLKERDRGRE